MAVKSKIHFKKSYTDLGKIVAWFDEPEFDLEEGIQKFKEGAKLVGELKRYLSEMKNTIAELQSET